MASKEFPGNQKEKDRLMAAIKHNCACEYNADFLTKLCGAHQLLNPVDNKWDRLVFARRMAGKLMVQELMPQHPTHPQPKYTAHEINMIHKLGIK